uniref:Uncharacterized protein n=1 Tax=Salix viminalis TaxID=40686 RepID=A0A6N2L534_SALVM
MIALTACQLVDIGNRDLCLCHAYIGSILQGPGTDIVTYKGTGRANRESDNSNW